MYRDGLRDSDERQGHILRSSPGTLHVVVFTLQVDDSSSQKKHNVSLKTVVQFGQFKEIIKVTREDIKKQSKISTFFFSKQHGQQTEIDRRGKPGNTEKASVTVRMEDVGQAKVF